MFGHSQAAFLIYRGLFALQHRGQESAGIVVSNGSRMSSVRSLGLVSEVFTQQDLKGLEGALGIGHVRYSTTGSTRLQNVQPLVVECVDGMWAVAHNGNLVNAARLRRAYQQAGAIFQTSTDSEILIHLLADPHFRERPHRVSRALAELEGAFSFLLMTPGCVMAARDRRGFRPLVIGRLDQAWLFASETCALRQVGAQYEREVQPGELVSVHAGGWESQRFADPPPEGLAPCIFELVYFARPDSEVFGVSVHATRVEYGARLAAEHPAKADVVIPIPDSGTCAALGYARASGIALDFGFIRQHYVGRTFIMPEAHRRAENADRKLSVIPEVVKGRRVVVVDDSVVRGTTIHRRVGILREAGAREVHVRISSPPVRYPCFYGIDFPTRKELLAADRDVEAIRQSIGADSLGYLSVDALIEPLKGRGGCCAACFTGCYPVPTASPVGKHDWDPAWGELDGQGRKPS